MNIIQNFEKEAIALFSLTLLGEETYFHTGNKAYLLIPFFNLGHYDDNIGMSHTYNKGYLVFEGIVSFDATVFSAISDEIANKVQYKIDFLQNNAENELVIEDFGFRNNRLVQISIKLKYQFLNLIYDFINYNYSPIEYNEITKNKDITDFLIEKPTDAIKKLLF